MPGDSTTTVTRGTWFGRIGESFKGVIVGMVLVVAAVYLLTWNEGRAVGDAKSLEEGAASVVSIAPDKVSPAHDGQLVHVSGEATTSDVLTDPVFAIAATALKLQRRVEVYQWVEDKQTVTRDKAGGGTETTTRYEYNKTWKDRLIDSGGFKNPENHQNPTERKFDDWNGTAEQVHLGKFLLSAGLLEQIHNFETLPVTDSDLERLSAELKGRFKVHRGMFYESKDPDGNPQIGDERIGFSLVKPAIVSLIAKQTGETFSAYHTKNNRTVEMVETGEHSAQAMFGKAMQDSSQLTWSLRLAGYLAMFVGLLLLVQPLVAVAKVVPILGDLLGWGAGLFAALVAAALSAATISVGWIAYSPVRGILLLVGAAGLLFILKRIGARHRAGRVS